MTSIITKLPAVRLRLNETDLCGWIGQAEPGDVMEYFRGFLAMDAASNGSCLAKHERAELVRVARRAWWASEQQLVHLVQRRHGPDDYSYLAIARSKLKQVSVSLSSLLLAEVA